MDFLLAKWRDDKTFDWARGYTLAGHMTEVLWGFDLLFSQPFDGEESFGHALHKRMGLKVSFEDFRLRCLLATAFHDLGKAGGEFQRMLWSKEEKYQHTKTNPGFCYTQAYRHEFLSGLLLYHVPELKAYVENLVGKGRPFFEVLSAAAGHHLKTTVDKGIRPDVLNSSDWKPKMVWLKLWCKAVVPLLVARGLPAFDLEDMDTATCWATEKTLADDWDKIALAAKKLTVARNGDQREPVDAAIKWIVILADVFGSVSQKPGERILDVRNQIAKELAAIGSPTEYDPMDRARRKLCTDNPELNPLQEAAARVEGNLIITAATGGGKTVAALAWASKQPTRRLIFAAHTTDAATVLYQDYATTQDALRHSKAWLDLKYVHTPEDRAQDEDDAVEEAQVTMSLFRDGLAPVTFCTVDQILGVPAFNRKSIMWVPYIITAQVVFDEIHSYDRRMTGWYERFLEYFPLVRTAHLSATLAHSAIQKIQSKIPATYEPSVYDALPSTTVPRYRVEVLDAPPTTMPDRCLWFTNVVDRCQAKSRDHKAVAYHSRFKQADRKKSREALMKGFRSGGSIRCVATQVAEMSLDIDADVMVSEIAPPAAMIQRMGRLNRQAHPHSVRTIYVYPHWSEPSPSGKKHHGFPYSTDPENWQASYIDWLDWMRGLEGRDLSQGDLESAFQTYMVNQVAKRHSATIPKMVDTERLSVRESGATTQVILRKDADKVMESGDKFAGADWARKKFVAELVSHIEFPIILNNRRAAQLRKSDSMLAYKLIVDSSDGQYDENLGWITR